MNFIDIDEKNFINIYKDLTEQFPAQELKSYERFLELLYDKSYKVKLINDGEISVGYIIFVELADSIWLDYIAVFKEHHSKGYGSKILNAVLNQFEKGIYLEVEKPDENVPNTLRRIKFYTNLGAQKLDYDYFYPAKEKPFSMDLYYLPYQNIFPENIENDIKQVFRIIHSDIEYLHSYIQ